VRGGEMDVAERFARVSSRRACLSEDEEGGCIRLDQGGLEKIVGYFY